MTLELFDLVPRPYGPYRGARPGAMAAAIERVMLGKMMSIGLTAQARMMRNGPSRAAEGWSSAEEGAYKAARALSLLTLAAQRLVKTYANEQRFADEREFGEIRPEPRVHTLAEQALYSTDPAAAHEIQQRRGGDDARADAIRDLQHRNVRRREAYAEATLARLREFDPGWVTAEQFDEAARTAEAAMLQDAPAPAAPRAADAAPDPDRARLAPDNDAPKRRPAGPQPETQKRVVVADAGSDTISGDIMPGAPAATARKRGAQPGNVLSLRTGRHTAEARAERAADAAMLREVRDICADAADLAAQRPPPLSP